MDSPSPISLVAPVARTHRPGSPRAGFIGVAVASAFVAACAGADLGGDETLLFDGTDAAGVRLEDYGLTEAPCGQDVHLATVVTSNRAYHAFCADERGSTSVLVVSPP